MHKQQLGIVFLCVGWLACKASVQSDLNEAQANYLLAELATHNIPGTKKRMENPEGATYTVEVSPSELQKAIRATQGLTLPEKENSSSSSKGRSFIPTAAEERAARAQALGVDLARTLRTLPGITEAHVHVSLPEPTALSLEDAIHSRASVLMQSRLSCSASQEQVVRKLVSGTIPQLDTSDVTVICTKTVAPKPAPLKWVYIGPIAVAPGSAGLLKAIGCGFLGLNALLACLLLFVWLRKKPTLN